MFLRSMLFAQFILRNIFSKVFALEAFKFDIVSFHRSSWILNESPDLHLHFQRLPIRPFVWCDGKQRLCGAFNLQITSCWFCSFNSVAFSWILLLLIERWAVYHLILRCFLNHLLERNTWIIHMLCLLIFLLVIRWQTVVCIWLIFLRQFSEEHLVQTSLEERICSRSCMTFLINDVCINAGFSTKIYVRVFALKSYRNFRSTIPFLSNFSQMRMVKCGWLQ